MTAPGTPTVEGLTAALRAGTTSAADLVDDALARARRSPFGAFVELREEAARADAARVDAELRAGRDPGPLAGVPIGVKDVLDVAGMWTRLGTPGLGHHRAERDADVVARLRAAGAVVVGKTRTHELAWGMLTPGCRNPRDPARVAGGSSGGSAVAVAAGIVALAVGTDTGGSVRNPAALCGVVGLKTAVGTLATGGAAPLAPTQDTIGFLGSTVADCRAALAACGAAPNPAPNRRSATPRVGVLADKWARRVGEPVAAALATARDRCDATEIRLPYSELAPAASYVTMLAESARAWWAEARESPGSVSRTVRDLLRLGALVTPPDYARALRVRDVLLAQVREALAGFDALLLPSCAVTAAPAGTDAVDVAGRRVGIEAAHASMTALASVTGLPAVSVPGPPAADGLPTGVQVVAADEHTALAVAETVLDRPGWASLGSPQLNTSEQDQRWQP